MITFADVERLLAAPVLAGRQGARAGSRPGARAEGSATPVLSLYLRVPADPAQLRELPARAHGLIALASGAGADQAAARGAATGGAAADGAAVLEAEALEAEALEAEALEAEARRLIEAHCRDWLGHTAAIFVAASDGSGRVESFPLPCELPDRAILASRPHIRPLLVALQRCPEHYIAVLDTRRAWLLRVRGDEVEAAGETTEGRQVRSRGFGGWYGLESHRINDRITELAHDHFTATVALLEHALRPGGQEPAGLTPARLVLAGHEQTVAEFSALLPRALRERVAGSVSVDPHTMTPAKVRDLARPVIDEWVAMHENWLAIQTRLGGARGTESGGGEPGGGKPREPMVVTGLNRCLEAVGQHAVELLVVPAGGIVSGYACDRCGALSSDGTGCGDGRAHARRVPDLFEEMVTRTLDHGGRVEALADPPGEVAAQLRFPVTELPVSDLRQ